MRFLVDENLSRVVVEQLQLLGYFAEKADYVGLGGHRDDLVWQHALDNDQIVITCNANDFLKLARTSSLHAGLIIIRRADLSREEQWRIVEPVIARLAGLKTPGLLNEYVEVFDFESFTWPPLPIP